MPRGGKRTNKPGDPARGNRTDMNTPTPSTGYGTRAAQERAMAAVPIQPAPGGSAPQGAPVYAEPSPPLSLDRPSERPNEPLTAGLPMGPGPGPDALGMALTAVDKLKLMYRRFPDPDLLDLIIAAEGE